MFDENHVMKKDSFRYNNVFVWQNFIEKIPICILGSILLILFIFCNYLEDCIPFFYIDAPLVIDLCASSTNYPKCRIYYYYIYSLLIYSLSQLLIITNLSQL